MDDLDVNVRAHGLYISLIVDVKGNYVCKGAFVSEIEEKSEICPVDFPANKLVMSKKVEKLVTFDFNVVKEAEEILVEDWFLERLNLIEELSKKQAAEEAKRRAAMAPSYHNRGVNTHLPQNKKKNKSKNHIPKHQPMGGVADAGWMEEFVSGLGTVYTNDAGVQFSEGGMPLTTEEQGIYDLWDAGLEY